MDRQRVEAFMATARDTLLAELLKLFKTAFSDRADGHIASLLERFRIQAKSGPDSSKGTARELLSAQLLKLWKTGSADLSKAILEAINQYRMQLKQTDAKKTGAKERVKAVSKKSEAKLASEPDQNFRRRRLR